MADHFSSEVYVVNPTAETAATTTGGHGTKKRNRKGGKITSNKSKLSNVDNSESKNSKPKPKPKPNPTSLPTLAP